MILSFKKNYPWYKYYIDMKKTISTKNVSMYEMVRKAALKYPDLTAVSYFGTKLSYKTFIKRIDKAAKAYYDLGVKKEDVVSIIMPNTIEAIVSFYALNKLGALVNMIHPLSSEEELKNALNLTESKYALVSDTVYEKVLNIKNKTKLQKIVYSNISDSMNPLSMLAYKLKTFRNKTNLDIDTINYSRFISKGKLINVKIKDKGKGKDNAVILHSGGTTGKPKGILLTNDNFNSVALGLLEINKVMGPGVSTLSIMPIFHGFGLACTFHAVLISGGESIILPIVSPKKFDQTILKYKPNTIGCVPSLLESIPYSNKLKNADLSFLKCIVCGGDSISPKLNEKVDSFLSNHGSIAKVRSAYGMTECTAGVTMMPLEKSKFGSVGIPIPSTVIKIIDPKTNKECKTNEVGEICISGPSVMKGYLNEKEETKNILKEFSDGKTYLHSGDLGYIDEDGFVFFSSRLKRMIVSSGYNIYPGEIEKIILEHPYVEDCVVVGVPHPYKKEVVKAYIVLKKGLVLNSEIKRSIKSHCEKNIASYALPYAYGYRKEIPKTIIGKIAYKELINDKEEEQV